MRKLFLLLLGLILVGNAKAATLCVGPAATGSGSGADWNNMMVPPSASGWVRGNTYYLADGTYSFGTLSTPVSGTTLITIKKATVADHGPSTGWVDTLGDGQAVLPGFVNITTSFWTLDGNGTWTIPTSVDSAYGISMQSASYLGQILKLGASAAVTDITIRYCRMWSEKTSENNVGLRPVYMSTTTPTSRIKLQNCLVRGGGDGILLGTANFVLIERCYVLQAGNKTVKTSWPENPGNFHGQTIMMHYTTTSVIIRWNVFDRCEGQALVPYGGNTTGPTLTQNIRFYGNLVFMPNGSNDSEGLNGGLISNSWEGGPLSNIRVYNNTYVNLNDAQSTNGTSTNFVITTSSAKTEMNHHNDLFYNCDPTITNGAFVNSHHAGGIGAIDGTSPQTGLAASIFVNYAGNDFRLASPTQNGLNLTAQSWWSGGADSFFGTQDSNQDMYGTVRGADGTWDRGAFEFTTASPGPVVQSATINAAGTQLAVVFNVNVSIGPNTGGMTLAMSGGAVTASSPTAAGTTVTWSLSRLIGTGETGTCTYVQPGNGIEAASGGADAGNFTQTVINNSTIATVNTPQFSPAPGAYFTAQNVTMTSSTLGATVRYTTDGTDPTSTTGTVYSGPVSTTSPVTYKARAFLSGSIDSGVSTGAYQVGTWTNTVGGSWKNFAVPQITTTFVWTFRASVSAANADAVIGMGPNTTTTFTDMGVLVRFNNANNIDVYNGTSYQAVAAQSYTPNALYDFTVTGDLATHTYSVTVTPPSGSPVVLATNYTFRSTQATATELDNVGMSVPVAGSFTVQQMSFGQQPGNPPLLTTAGIAPAGNLLNLSFDLPVTFGAGGSGGWTMAASGGAATLSVHTPSGAGSTTLSYDISRVISAGEVVTISYTNPTNGVEAVTGGVDLAAQSAFNVNNGSSTDTIAPLPNPAAFTEAPFPISSTAVSMVAVTATDAGGSNPVQYFFDEVSGNSGGSDSGWQISETFNDNGLSGKTQYGYRVKSRDAAGNETDWSAIQLVTTPEQSGARMINASNVRTRMWK
jgi:hypothetical protein